MKLSDDHKATQNIKPSCVYLSTGLDLTRLISSPCVVYETSGNLPKTATTEETVQIKTWQCHDVKRYNNKRTFKVILLSIFPCSFRELCVLAFVRLWFVYIQWMIYVRWKKYDVRLHVHRSSGITCTNFKPQDQLKCHVEKNRPNENVDAFFSGFSWRATVRIKCKCKQRMTRFGIIKYHFDYD